MMRSSDLYSIEGRVCFMNCPIGLEPRIEEYDIWPDGTVRYAITLAAKLPVIKPELEAKK